MTSKLLTRGSQVSAPLGFSPSAAHKLAHSDGELATSRAAARKGIPMCLSTYSTTRMEDVIEQGAGRIPFAKQVSFLKDRDITERIIKRAESMQQYLLPEVCIF